MKRWFLWGIPAGVLFVIAGLAAYMLLFLRIVQVPTGAMANTVIPGDSLLVTKRVGEIKRGDLVLFKFPQDPKIIYLKRVIGLPGDKVLLRSTEVLVNDQPVPEQHVY